MLRDSGSSFQFHYLCLASQFLVKLLTIGILFPPYSTIPINPASSSSSPYRLPAQLYNAKANAASANAATRAPIPISTETGVDIEFSDTAEVAEEVATEPCGVYGGRVNVGDVVEEDDDDVLCEDEVVLCVEQEMMVEAAEEGEAPLLQTASQHH